jgi:hypothetical protein
MQQRRLTSNWNVINFYEFPIQILHESNRKSILPIIDVIIYLAEICKDRLYTLFGTGSESLKRSRTIVALSRSNLCNSILAIFER